jgi:subtilisin-like proprotein convertase family protein
VNLRHDTAGDLRISLRSPSAADAVFLFNNNVRTRLSAHWHAPLHARLTHRPRSAASPTWNPMTSP